MPIFKKKIKNDTTMQVSDILLRALLNGSTITREMAMTLPAVASAVDRISSTIAMLPIKLYEVKDGNSVELIDYRTNLLNDDTKDTLDGFQFKKALIEDYLLGKGGYAFINKQRNIARSLNYVKDSDISIQKNSDPIFKVYNILVNGKTYEPYEFIKLLRRTTDGMQSKSLIQDISKPIETAYQTILYQLNLVKTGGNKKGFVKSQNKLSKEAIEELKNAWNTMYQDSNANCVVLNNGLDFQESSNSSVEMQLNESKESFTEEINAVFHISDNYNDFFKNAIQPILAEFETALNRDLLLEKEKPKLKFMFEVKEVNKTDLKSRYEAYKIGIDAGLISINEARYKENLPAIEGLDVYKMSLANVIYDPLTQTYFTPNTKEQTKLGGGGNNE